MPRDNFKGRILGTHRDLDHSYLCAPRFTSITELQGRFLMKTISMVMVLSFLISRANASK